MHKLVITGIRGFIGLNFLDVLNSRLQVLVEKKGIDTIVLVDAGLLQDVNNEYPHAYSHAYNGYIQLFDSAKKLGVDIKFIDVDINSPEFKEQIEGIGESVDVINFASESHVDDSNNSPSKIFKANTELLPNLVSGIGMDNIRGLFHVRTDEEYGQLETRRSKPFTHDSPINPRNTYSASKASQTLFLESLKNVHNLDVHYWVLANQFGSYQHHTKMIPATIKNIIDGKSAKIYGDGKQLREWTFVEDTVNHIFNSYVFEQDFDVIHIADKKGLMSNNDLVKTIIRTMKKEYGIKGSLEYVEDRKGHDFCYKMKSDFINFKPVKQSLTDTIKFYYSEYTR